MVMVGHCYMEDNFCLIYLNKDKIEAMADRTYSVRKIVESNEEETTQGSHINVSAIKDLCIITTEGGRKIIDNSMKSQITKPKYNYSDRKRITVNITNESAVIATNTRSSGPSFKEEEFSGYKKIDSCNDKKSVAKHVDEETYNTKEQSGTKEKIIKNYESFGRTEQNLKIEAEINGKEIIRSKAETSSNVTQQRFNRNDFKKIIVKIFNKSKKKIATDNLMSDSSANTSQYGMLVKREETSELENIDSTNETKKTLVTKYEDKESCFAGTDQRIDEIYILSSLRHSEQNCIRGTVSNEKEGTAFTNEYKDVKQTFDPDAIRCILNNLNCTSNVDFKVDSIIVHPNKYISPYGWAQREDVLEQEIIQYSEKAETSSANEFKDKEICSVDKEDVREIQIKSSVSKEPNLRARGKSGGQHDKQRKTKRRRSYSGSRSDRHSHSYKRRDRSRTPHDRRQYVRSTFYEHSCLTDFNRHKRIRLWQNRNKQWDKETTFGETRKLRPPVPPWVQNLQGQYKSFPLHAPPITRRSIPHPTIGSVYPPLTSRPCNPLLTTRLSHPFPTIRPLYHPHPTTRPPLSPLTIKPPYPHPTTRPSHPTTTVISYPLQTITSTASNNK